MVSGLCFVFLLFGGCCQRRLLIRSFVRDADMLLNILSLRRVWLSGLSCLSVDLRHALEPL